MTKHYNATFIFGITLVATLGGLLFGYDTAVISGAEKSIEAYLIKPLGLSSLIHGATVSSALIGCILGGRFLVFYQTIGVKENFAICFSPFFRFCIGIRLSRSILLYKGRALMALLLTFNFTE